MNPSPIVLVIDDGPISPALVQRAVRDLEQKIRVVIADNIDDAKTAFNEEQPRIIVLNACLNGGRPNTKPFLEELRSSFHFGGTIMITSVMENYQRRLSCFTERLQHKYLFPGQTISVDYDQLSAKLLHLLKG